MSTDTPGYSPMELRDMDEQTARETLTVAEYERWEKIQELYDEAEETQERFDEQAETVTDITVSADMEQLGTRVDVYGNDLLVHVDTESREFHRATQRLDDEFGDITVEDETADGPDAFGEVDHDRLDKLADHLLEMLDTVLVKWDGTRWSDLTEDQRQTILQQCRSEWKVDGLMLAWGDIVSAAYEDKQQKVEEIEQFLG